MSYTFDLEAFRKHLFAEGSVAEVDSNLPGAAVAIIINPKDRDGSMLMIERTKRAGDPWSGQIAFPGGHKAAGDRTSLETAIREAKEEVGISLMEHEFLGILPLVPARTKEVLVAPFVFQLKRDVTVRCNQEVAASFWVPLNTLSQLKVCKSDVHFDDRDQAVDSYNYNDHVIWGLTFRIINILLAKDT